LICCINKNQELNSKNNKKNEKSITERKEVGKKYMSYDEFNKKYFYWNGVNSFLRSDSNKLEKYILKYEFINDTKIAISICTLFVLPAKISELDLKYMSRLGLAYSF